MQMKPTRGLLTAVVLGLMICTAGCSDENNPTVPLNTGPLTQSQADDIASQLALSLGSDNGGSMAELQAARAGAVSAMAAGPSFSTTGEEDSSFVVGNINFSFSYSFRDDQGNEQPFPDSSTAKLVTVTRAWGTMSDAETEVTIGHSAEWCITGIQQASETLTFNGLASDTVEAVHTPQGEEATATLDWIASMALADVVFHKDPMVNEYPLSGIGTWTVDAHATYESPQGSAQWDYAAVAVITFNGTDTPTVIINGTYTYEINLKTGEATAV